MGGGHGLTDRARAAVGALMRDALALAVPRACLICDASMGSGDFGLACGTCWSRLPLLPKPWCPRCGYPLTGGVTAAQADCARACSCAQLDARVTRVRSVCWVPHRHSSPLLAALKYQGWWGVADGMAERMVRAGSDLLPERDAPVFVPVPLAAARRRERGYNQSLMLASALARRTRGEVLDDAVVRIRATTSQTRLTPAERHANVQNAFVMPVSARAAVEGRAVVLVDDVLTTGATLNACAAALLDGGASDIRYWTFGRARSGADRP